MADDALRLFTSDATGSFTPRSVLVGSRFREALGAVRALPELAQVEVFAALAGAVTHELRSRHALCRHGAVTELINTVCDALAAGTEMGTLVAQHAGTFSASRRPGPRLTAPRRAQGDWSRRLRCTASLFGSCGCCCS